MQINNRGGFIIFTDKKHNLDFRHEPLTHKKAAVRLKQRLFYL
ncbi:hypothetical protein PESP_a2136 [Pseudoalteromonas espejiana DSM 9414]|nr:hypothetical protein PESP_a2136 [Pseudoalteromonas espejiana DSM 9414]